MGSVQGKGSCSRRARFDGPGDVVAARDGCVSWFSAIRSSSSFWGGGERGARLVLRVFAGGVTGCCS